MKKPKSAIVEELANLLDTPYSKALSCKEKIKECFFKRIPNATLEEFESCFENMFKKFDINNAGPVGENSFPGRGKPKTYEFYFQNYCYNRINFIAVEARALRNKKINQSS